MEEIHQRVRFNIQHAEEDFAGYITPGNAEAYFGNSRRLGKVKKVMKRVNSSGKKLISLFTRDRQRGTLSVRERYAITQSVVRNLDMSRALAATFGKTFEHRDEFRKQERQVGSVRGFKVPVYDLVTTKRSNGKPIYKSDCIRFSDANY